MSVIYDACDICLRFEYIWIAVDKGTLFGGIRLNFEGFSGRWIYIKFVGHVAHEFTVVN